MNVNQDIRAHSDLITQFGANANSLLELCREQIEGDILDAIAAADYGSDKAAHRQALDVLLRQDEIARSFDWVPGEVLRLVRWSSPETRQPEFGGIHLLTVSQLHWARAFVCTLLMRSDEDMGAHDTLVVLVESAAYLGPKAERCCAELIAWRLSEPGSPEPSAPFLLFALAFLAVRREPAFDPALLAELALVLEQTEAQVAAENEASRSKGSKVWLLRTELMPSLLQGRWQGIATKVWHQPGAPARLRDCCARMCPDLADRIVSDPLGAVD